MKSAPAVITIEEAIASASDTRLLEVGFGALSQVPAAYEREFPGSRGIIVADENTWRVAGEKVAEAFSNHFQQRVRLEAPYIFQDAGLYAEYGFVEKLVAHLKGVDAIPIAVGSGTINDLAKLAAHMTRRPYMCVATAASMDGYAAFGASITHNGSKQTFHCPAPQAIVADLEIIAKAPGLMNSWGYADLLAKTTAGADWLLADALGVEPINPGAWDIVQGGLREAVGDPAGVLNRNADALGRLLQGLVMGGFAMQHAKSSRPASGAEHQFSHLWDMQHHVHNGQPPSHGFKVAIGTLAVSALYEFLLDQPIQDLDVDKCSESWASLESWIERSTRWLAEPDLREVARKELTAKHADVSELKRQLETLRTVWKDLSQKLLGQLPAFDQLRGMLQAAGAPTEPEQIGISRERLRASYWQAFCIRRRFTILDVAARCGLLDQALDYIFGDRGRWPARNV